MKLEMRRALARESFAEKIRKVERLVRLTKTFPRATAPSAAAFTTSSNEGKREPREIREQRKSN